MHRESRSRCSTGTETLDWCHRSVQGVSRTFAITVDVLEEPMASSICVGYLLCRTPDTIEDSRRIPPDEQVRLLNAYDRALDPDDETDIGTFRDAVDEWIPDRADRSDDWDLVAHAPRVVDAFEAQPERVQRAVRGPVRELVQGMAMFVERYADEGGLRIQTLTELEEYCHYVAGTVGELITNLVCRGDVSTETAETLRENAESFALLLQLVNIAKDVYADFDQENNVYLPATWLRERGVSQEEICDPAHAEQVADAVDRTADHARGFLDDAQAYLEAVPETGGNTLVAWGIPFLLAVGTLREVTERPEDALREAGVKVSREEVHAIIASVSGGVDRDLLGDLRETIAETPYHRAADPTSCSSD